VIQRRVKPRNSLSVTAGLARESISKAPTGWVSHAPKVAARGEANIRREYVFELGPAPGSK
jgi:hypothetical protein